jgi:hypothetical protein
VPTGTCLQARTEVMNDEELKAMAQSEKEMVAEYNEIFQPHPYRKAFYVPSVADWDVDAAFLDGFFESAVLLLERVVAGEMLESRGVAAVFLCRHYLELRIKYTLFHSRWLKDVETNASDAEVEPVKKIHKLRVLWDTLRKELTDRVPEVLKFGYDFDFVGEFVDEFESVDPAGWRFRYRTEQLAATVNSQTQTNLDNTLWIDFETLLFALKRVERVLRDLDMRLVNTYGLNEEYQSELNSL